MSAGRRTPVALAAVLAAGLLGVASAAGGADPGPPRTASTTEWLPLASGPLDRTEIGAARIGRYIYDVGGFEPGLTSDKVARYDIKTNSWELLSPMPVAVNHPGTVAYRGFLYVYGGFNGLDVGGTDGLQRYDPRSDTWTTLTPSGHPSGAMALEVVRGRLYAIGGAGNTPLATVEIYDIALDRWSSGPSMRFAREHIASAAIGPRIFVLGGRAFGQNLRVVERLDTRTGLWVKLPGLTVARSGFQAVAVR